MREIEVIEQILFDLAENETRTEEKHKGFPPVLWLGDGSYIHVNSKTLELVSVYRRLVYGKSHRFKNHFSVQDFSSTVHRAFANVLSDRDFESAPQNHIEDVVNGVDAYIENETKQFKKNGSLEYCFGCSLVDEKSFQPFSIGPVRFETRKQWLDRKADAALGMEVGEDGRWMAIPRDSGKTQVSLTTKRRVEKAWRGQNIRKRKSSQEYKNEKDIVRTLNGWNYVGTVHLPRFATDFAQGKAKYAIDVALAGVSLVWREPARAAQGLHHSFGSQRSEKRWMVISNNTLSGGGSSRSDWPSASRISEQPFHEDLSDFENELQSIGKAIEWYIDPSAEYANPKVLSVIAQALFWFNEACREENDLKAITGFAASIDVLAAGVYSNQRLLFLQRHLELTADSALFKDGMTLSDFDDHVFDKRNRMVHGPVKSKTHVWGAQFTYDWSETRKRAEVFVRLCLLSCLTWVHQNPDVDDPSNIGEKL